MSSGNEKISYKVLDEEASKIAPGSDGLIALETWLVQYVHACPYVVLTVQIHPNSTCDSRQGKDHELRIQTL